MYNVKTQTISEIIFIFHFEFMMQLKILQGINGAKKAKETAVIIDVFRASSTIIACLHNESKKIIPVESVEKAFLLKEKYPSWILVGERNGKKIDGFDYGNSPSTMASLYLKDKTIILSTSSGTKGIINAENTDECLIASFTNISKVISYLREKNKEKISIIPMGLNATTPAIEDDLCAEYILKSLQNKHIEYPKMIKQIKQSKGYQRLQRLKQHQDMPYCLQINRFPLVPVYIKEKQTKQPIIRC